MELPLSSVFLGDGKFDCKGELASLPTYARSICRGRGRGGEWPPPANVS